MCGLENLSSLFKKANESLRGRPKMICACDRLQSRSGVLRNCNIARRKRSWSRLPDEPVFDVRRRSAAFTATSALPFDCGKPTTRGDGHPTSGGSSL